MKKTVFVLFTFLAVNISAIAQCNQRPNADHYLLQGNTYLHAEEIDLNPFDSNGECKIPLGHANGLPANIMGCNDWQRTTIDYAQMQHSDTLQTIVGVSALLLQHNYGLLKAYLCIADSNFNIYRRVQIPNDSVDCNYTELFFEQPINVNGDFSIIWENPKPDTIQSFYNYSGLKPRILVWPLTKDTTNCGFYLRYSHPDGTIDTWDYFFNQSIYMYLPYRHVAYLLPIFGELDTTLSLVGQPEDTITQPEDTSSLARINMVDKYSHIFPNPAKEKLNVQSSFKIEDIEVFNYLGQKIFEKGVKGYNTTIDIANFEKGNYILKINSLSGVTNKKFIIQ